MKLDRLMQTHVIVAGSGSGRRWAAEELNHAIVLRLASEFQGFCRELHTEAVDFVADVLSRGDHGLKVMVRFPYEHGRRLDRGNADPSALGSDFGLLGMRIWDALRSTYPAKGELWRRKLELLNAARNGIAHDDQTKLGVVRAAGWPLTLASARSWRAGLDGLVVGMDHVVKRHVQDTLKVSPW
ncbi:hypothetical protein [Fodinicola feengrottensis]|uniref:hypothetical protein n=1 Tax=Fodinicola feengrottensis TaxID=435914 RepID=UPI0031D28EAA